MQWGIDGWAGVGCLVKWSCQTGNGVSRWDQASLCCGLNEGVFVCSGPEFVIEVGGNTCFAGMLMHVHGWHLAGMDSECSSHIDVASYDDVLFRWLARIQTDVVLVHTTNKASGCMPCMPSAFVCSFKDLIDR